MNDEVDPLRPSAPPPSPDGVDQRRRWAFFAIWGIVVLGVVITFREVLMPFLLAVIVAYVLAPVVELVQKLEIGRGKHLPKWASVIIVKVVLVASIVTFFVVGVPRLVVEIEKLTREIPETVQTARDEWLPTLEQKLRQAMAPYEEPLTEDEDAAAEGDVVAEAEAEAVPEVDDTGAIHVTPNAEGGFEITLPESGVIVAPDGDRYRITTAHREAETRGDLTASVTEAIRKFTDNTQATAVTILKTAQTVVRWVVRSVFLFFIMLMLSAYLLVTSESILAFFRSLAQPRRRRNFDRLVMRIDRGLSGVVRGQVAICIVNGVLSGIGFYLLELRYWPILALVATVLSIIPIFGAILSSIPAVVIALQDSWTTAVFTLVWIIAIHQIEANLLNPKIMGDAAKVHPVLVVFALLAGEHLFGLAGALLAVPVLSIVQSLFLHYREVMLGVPTPARERRSAPPPAPLPDVVGDVAE